MSRARPFAPVEAYEPDMPPVRPPMIKEIEHFSALKPALTSTYLIKGVLDRGTLSVIYGASNCGKTFFTLDLAFHVAARPYWRGRKVENGAVLYLAAEGGSGIINRLVALREAHNISDAPLYVRRMGLDLLRPEADVQRVIDAIKELGRRSPVKLVVVDTLSRALAGGDENGSVDMSAFVGNCDRIRQETGVHLLIVHHTGKDEAKGARGHSSLKASLDTEIEIKVADKASGLRIATASKQRDNPVGDEFPFELRSIELGLDQDGDPVRTCVVASAEKPSPFDGLTTDDLKRVQVAVGRGDWRENPQSNVWVGLAVAECLELDPSEPSDISRIKSLLSIWIKNGALQVVERLDNKRMKRKFVVVGDPA